jgi:hypothetical protein
MEDKIPNGIPPFDGSNFEYWSNRMETYLKALGQMFGSQLLQDTML